MINALHHCFIRKRSLALGEPAKLYGFCNTGPKHLDEFGIGIGLYFRQLYYLVIITMNAPPRNLSNLARIYHNCHILKFHNLNHCQAVVFGVCVLVYICSIIHNQGFNGIYWKSASFCCCFAFL